MRKMLATYYSVILVLGTRIHEFACNSVVSRQ
jgi:hypothetical protein